MTQQSAGSAPHPSELRAVLAQPSKLKEQMLHCGGSAGASTGSAASQHSPIDARVAPPPPSQHSPRDMTSSFQLQEAPRSRSNSKASDHRGTPTPTSAQMSVAAAAHEQLMQLGLPVVPQPGMLGMPPPGLQSYHAGHLAGLHFRQMQQVRMPMPLDLSHMPDMQQMMAAQAQAQAGMMGLARHPVSSQQPQALHSPQVTTPLTPQMPLTPVAALPDHLSYMQHNREVDAMMATLRVRHSRYLSTSVTSHRT